MVHKVMVVGARLQRRRNVQNEDWEKTKTNERSAQTGSLQG